jgi:hypothetical protein
VLCCSTECDAAARRKRRSGRDERSCDVCGKPFEPKRSDAAEHRDFGMRSAPHRAPTSAAMSVVERVLLIGMQAACLSSASSDAVT